MGGPLQKYDVTLPGGRKTVMKLNEDDAKRYNATLVGAAPELEPEPEAAEAPAPKPAAKKRAVSNKARTAANKDGGTGGGD